MNADVIIFSGQSNMCGETERLTNNDVIPNAFEYSFINNSFLPLSNPVGENITYNYEKGVMFAHGGDMPLDTWLNNHITGAAYMGYTNLVPEFCRSYTNITGKNVVAVHVAKGSTQIDYWLPHGNGYDFLVYKSKLAIEKAKTNFNINNIYFVWLQGESDQIFGVSKEHYKDKLICLNNELKKDLGINKFGIILVGRFTGTERDDEIIDAQKETCKSNSDFALLTDITQKICLDSNYLNSNVAGHYNAVGLELIGKLAGESLANIDLNK